MGAVDERAIKSRRVGHHQRSPAVHCSTDPVLKFEELWTAATAISPISSSHFSEVNGEPNHAHHVRELEVCQKAVDCADRIAALTETFPRGYDFLVEQLNRAAISIATSLAEANGRFTKADRRNFFTAAPQSWRLFRLGWRCLLELLEQFLEDLALAERAQRRLGPKDGVARYPPFGRPRRQSDTHLLVA
jgi:hypothetical protein